MSPATRLGGHRLIFRLMALAARRWPLALLLLCLQAASPALSMMSLEAAGVAIDLVTRLRGVSSAAGVLEGRGIAEEVYRSALVVGGLSLLRAVLSYGYAYGVAHFVQFGVAAHLRQQMIQSLQQRSFDYHDRNPAGSLLTRLTTDIDSLGAFFKGVLFQAVSVTCGGFIFGTYIFMKHPWLALACFSTFPILVFLESRVSTRMLPTLSETRVRVDKFVETASEFLAGIGVLLSIAGADIVFLRKLRARSVRLHLAQRAVSGIASRFWPLTEVTSQTPHLILLAYGGVLVYRHLLSVGELLVIAGLLRSLQWELWSVTSISTAARESLLAAERVFAVLDGPPSTTAMGLSHVTRTGRPRSSTTSLNDIRFEAVTFGYEPGSRVLGDVSFVVRQGEHVGLLGAVGSGKTTLLSLIPRLYEVSSGRICIGDCDVRELSLEALRGQVAFAYQDSYLFGSTIAENIKLGASHATHDDVAQVAALADIHDFICTLPDRYQTKVADSGVTLSGGQRQRIALARALLTKPAILLVDDPTSSLDASTGRRVLDRIRSHMHGRTLLIASSDPAVLSACDRTLVLDGRGSVVEASATRALAAACDLIDP